METFRFYRFTTQHGDAAFWCSAYPKDDEYIKKSDLDKLLKHKIEFKDPKDAPKDRPFLAFFKSWPTCVTVSWDGADCQWTAAILQTGLYHGEWNNNYFENEQFEIKDMIKWCELPEDK
jgi:hypothetical protein